MGNSISEIDDGGSAFPAMLPGGNYCTPGMSLLDWFAGQALSRIASAMARDGMSCKQIASGSYSLAIAMLNERERMNASAESEAAK